MNELHGEYVLVSADEASIILVVCKKYYLDMVIKELVDRSKLGSSTFVECHDSIDNKVKEHLQYMNSNIPEEINELQTFYWLPKMHKTPVGSRFIAACAWSSYTTKPFSKLMTTCLNLIIQHYKEYNEGITRSQVPMGFGFK